MKRTTLTILIALAIVLAGVGGYFLLHDHADPGDAKATEAQAQGPDGQNVDPGAEDPGDGTGNDQGDADGDGSNQSGSAADKSGQDATLFFASDYQGEDGFPAPSATLSEILISVQADHPKLDGLIYCGDYTNVHGQWDYQLSPDDSIEEIKGIVSGAYPDLAGDRILFTQGNHDHLTDSITASDLHEYEDYLVYVMNTESDFPWKQGKTGGCLDKVKNSSKELKTCLDGLISRGESRPVIIAIHVPLHYTARTSSLHTTGDNLYSSLVFDVINEAGRKLDIVCIHGHNHSKGWDSYLGGSSAFMAPGDQILIPAFEDNDTTTDRYTEETLTFTYFNAGYTGYVSDTSSDTTLTGTVCRIQPDKLTIYRYSGSGIHPVRENGAANNYVDDTALIPSEYYGTRLESPVEVPRH